MQIKVFAIPAMSENADTEELNRFLRGHRVVEIKKEFYENREGVAYWTFCVTYLADKDSSSTGVGEKRKKIDYKTVLSEEEFERFTRLRKVRKRLAEVDDVPAFAVFTDEELSVIARQTEITSSVVLSVKGVGARRLEHYGKDLCRLYAEVFQNKEIDETSGQSDGENP